MPRLRQRAFVPGLLFVGTMVSIISSLGAPLIPTIARDFGVGLENAQWSLTVTMLVGAVASPLIGRLGDGPHRRAVLLGCLFSVMVGGALAAVAVGAESLVLLILGRALQGMGLALMPLTMAAARDELSAEHGPRVIAALSVTAAVGVGLGYPVTGLIAQTLDLSAAFWFGAATATLSLAIAWFVVPRRPAAPARTPIDGRGALLVGLGLVALLLTLQKGATWGWTSATTLLLSVLAVGLLGVWIRHTLTTADPLVDLRLLRHRPVMTANVSGLLIGVAMYLCASLITQVVQVVDGLNATILAAGFTLVPLSVMSFVGSRFLPAVQDRIGTRPTIPIGALAISAGAFFYAVTGDHLWQAFVTSGLVGVGLGFTFAAMPTLIVGAVPAAATSSAMSLYQVTRYIGFSIGSGLAVTLLHGFGGTGTIGTSAYASTFLVAGGLGVASAAIVWLMTGSISVPPRDGTDDLRALEIESGMLGAAGLEGPETQRRGA